MRHIGILMLVFLTTSLLAAGVVYAQGHQWLDDPGQLGHYAIGHTNYLMFDKDRGDRPVFFSVWYPVDPKDVNASTPPAEYLTDPYTNLAPPTYWFWTAEPTNSTDWEALGYDRAYEGPKASDDVPFPLVMVSPGMYTNNWQYIFVGTRLASHGYVVAVLEQWADWEWDWSPLDDIWTMTLNRPLDVSFAITQLLAKSRTPGELLFRTIDPERIVASGHSLGGYSAYALAGGDNMVCDTLWVALEGMGTLPYPANTCVPITRDRRVKALVAMEGASSVLHYRELARISVPSLILGETVDQLETYFADGSWRDVNARPHAAIDREDSYRVDVNGANHMSFTDYCDAIQVFLNRGWFSPDDAIAWGQTSWPCANTGWDPVTLSSAEEHTVVTKYMIAFLDTYFGGPDKNKWLDWWILTPEYALTHKPSVQFFDSEDCHSALPDHTYFTYRDYQLSSVCEVAQKDPTGWFASPSTSASSNVVTPMILAPAPASGGPFRPLKQKPL
ncbi:MAG TPA: hypothetical protein VFB10_11090 [Candidatus Dormibacteraeota bacterium]|nr:hypothetical protein [Candidatus Dormibacteraeota bacterium]